jgi:hypothetical protein
MLVEEKWWPHEGIGFRFSSMAWDKEEDKREERVRR